MLEIVCLILLTIILFLMCIFIFTDGQKSKKAGGKFLFVIAIIFVVFSFVFKPEDFIRWDLIEHFKIVDDMRLGGLEYVKNESQYADLFVYNYFAYLISLLPLYMQNLLTTIPLIIDFAIVGYIYKTTFNKHLPDASAKARVLAVLLWLFTFGIKLAISGIRCSLAVSIVVLAIYLEMIQKKKRILSLLLYITSIFIHNFAVVVIVVRILAMVKKPVLIMLLSLGICILLEPISRLIVNNVDGGYFKFSFGRILDTYEQMSLITAISTFNFSTLIVYIGFIVLSLYLFAVSTSAQKQNLNGYSKCVANFTATVGALAIGLSFNYLYLERFMYLVSFALLMIAPIHNENKNRINSGNIMLVPMAFLIFFFNDIYTFMVNYVGTYFLAF